MRSLFTRVFASFWIAIVAFVLATMALTTINFAARVNEPRAVTREAANVLREEGVDGLKHWLAARNERYPKQRTLVIDSAGEDLLGQALPNLRRLPPPPPGARPPEDRMPGPPLPMPGPPPWAADALIRGADGAPYWVLFDPPPRRGPFAPPFSPAIRIALVALALAISGLVSFLLARSIARPLRDLQGTARALADGRLETRAPAGVVERPDEIGALGRDFDLMAERLAALVTARQQLLRDLSHELRSPLARLRLAVELARQSGADTERQFDRIELESERLEALIAQILQFARFERDPATLERRDVDLAEVVQQVVHDAEYESRGPVGRISLEIAEGLGPVRADPKVLHAAIDNLVRNALRHGGDGAIEVLLAGDAAASTLTVRDHGPGVPAADLERIFEPFYRVPREGGAAAPGTGIGLAVAAKAVQLHGGTLVAENAVGGGLRMKIRLPRGA